MEGTSLAVQWLRLPMQEVWVRSLVRELRPHTPRDQKTKTQNRSNIVTDSIKTLETVHIKKKKIFKKIKWKITQRDDVLMVIPANCISAHWINAVGS